MNLKALTCMAVVSAGLVLAASLAQATEPANPHIPAQKAIGKPQSQAPVPSLGVVNSDGATLEGDKLTYTVDLLEGSLPAKGELVSVFIDPFGRPLSPVSLAGMNRRARRRGR